MPEACTCGTQLVENARFCHRCGRPTFEPEPEQTPPPLPPRQPTLQDKLAQLPVNFGNPIALRVAFLMSLGITLLQMIPFVQLLFLVWWPAAGWGAVMLYRKITGLVLSVSAGARLGSITGIMVFVCLAARIALGMVVDGKELLDQMVKQDPRLTEFAKDPQTLAGGMFFGFVLLFAVVVGCCATGGALGARRLARKAS
jgi:hypothetical protein